MSDVSRRRCVALLGTVVAMTAIVGAAPAAEATTSPAGVSPGVAQGIRGTGGVAARPAGPHIPGPPSSRITSLPPLLRLHRYELVNLSSQLRADVMWARTAPMTGAFLWPDNGSRSQEFHRLPTDRGWFRLRARHSGQCLMLDWRQGRYRDGTRVLQHPYCGDEYAASQWRFVTLTQYSKPCTQGPPFFCGFAGTASVLVNRRTGRCLDAENGALGRPPERAVLQQWECARYVDDPKIGNQGWGLLDLDAPPPPPIR